MKSIFGGSAIVATAFLSAFLFLSAKPSVAETLLSQLQQSAPQSAQTPSQSVVSESALKDSLTTDAPYTVSGKVVEATEKAESPVSPPVSYVATAYSLRGRTASGRFVSKGIIAADPRHLPLGSRVRVEAGPWSGEYLVADTGGMIKGRKIDIWTPSTREAMRFGRRTVKLTVLSYGARRISKKRRAQI